jgi:phospholipase/carboxylesterase
MTHEHKRTSVVAAGVPLKEAKKAAIMIHGRGADAADILSLSSHLKLDDFALLAPQADQHTWYPYSFLAPPQENQPGLDSALALLEQLKAEIEAAGIEQSNLYLMGFSQGACLTLEFAARIGGKWGGVIAFSGGLIGDQLYRENYAADMAGTPVFIGCSDRDAHIPEGRVQESAAQFRDMKASVQAEIYPGMGHTIIQDEIEVANGMLGG